MKTNNEIKAKRKVLNGDNFIKLRIILRYKLSANVKKRFKMN